MAWNVKDFLEEQKRLEELKRKNAGAQITKEEALAKIKADAAKPVSMPKSTSGDAVYTPLPVHSKTAQEQAAVKRTAKTQPKSTRNEYYSQPEDIYAQTQELRARLAANEARVKNLQGRLENRKRAYELTGDKKYAEKYQREYKEYQSAIGQYGKDVNSYNAYTQAETQRYNDWRSTVRKPERVQLELDAYTAKIEQLEEQRANIGKALGGLGTERSTALAAQIEELSAKRNKLSEELLYSNQFYYEDIRNAAEDFEEQSKPGAGKDYDYKHTLMNIKDNEKRKAKDVAGIYAYATKEERDMYNYLYNTRGKEAADKYMEDMKLEEELSRRAGRGEYEEHEKKSGIVKGIDSLRLDIGAGLQDAMYGTYEALTGNAVIDTPEQYAQSMMQENSSGVGKVVHGFMRTVSNMAPSILLSMATSNVAGMLGAGAKVAGTVGKVTGAASMGTSAAGNAYSEKIKAGYDPDKARTYATLVGASEATLQYLLGGISKLGGKVSGKVLAKNIEAIDKGFLRVAAKFGMAGASEALEENLQEFLEPAFASWVFNEKYDAPELEELVYTTIISALTGGFFESSEIRSSEINRAAEQAQKNTAESGGVRKIVPDMDDNERASILAEKRITVPTYDNSQPISTEEVSQLKGKYMSGAKGILQRIAEKCGVFRSDYYNADVDLQFEYSKSSKNKSYNEQSKKNATAAEDFGKMLTLLPEIIDGAIEIQSHTDEYIGTRREDPELKEMHVLLGAFRDGEKMVPIKLEVKEFKSGASKNNKLYLTVTLNEKESGVTARIDDDKNHQLVRTTADSKISITDLLADVKDDSGYFFKYIPDSMLNEVRIESKKIAVAENEARIAKMREEYAAEKTEQQKARQEKAIARRAAPVVNTGNEVLDRDTRAESGASRTPSPTDKGRLGGTAIAQGEDAGYNNNVNNMEVNDNEQREQGVRIREGSQRSDGAYTGGQVSAVEKSARRKASGDVQKNARARREKAEAARAAEGRSRVSAKELGISKGTKKKTCYIAPESALTQEEIREREKKGRAGIEIIYVVGEMEVEENGAKEMVRGVLSSDGKKMWVQIDNEEVTSMQIMKHEAFHRLKRTAPRLISKLREDIIAKYGKEELDELTQAYIDAYEWGADVNVDYVLEEIFADAYAGIDVFEYLSDYEGATRFSEEVQSGTEQYARESGTAESSDGAKYSISPHLRRDLKAVLDGQFDSSNSEVLIGTTSDFMVNTLKADPLRVTMPANKAYAAMVTEEQAKAEGRYDANLNHHGLGINKLIQVLIASENPIAAFVDTNEVDKNGKVKDRSDRIVLVTDKRHNGNNIVVVMQVNVKAIHNRKRVSVNKDVTTFDRKSIKADIKKAANDKRLLHLDKKRSQTTAAGVPAANSPTAIQRGGFEKNIAYFWNNVKWKKEGSKSNFESPTAKKETAMEAAMRKAEENSGGEKYSRGRRKGEADYSGEKVKWAVDNGIISEKDRTDFFHIIANISKLGHKVRRTRSGGYVVDLGNKLLFTDADWHSPSLSSVVIFNDHSETAMEYAKEVTINGRQDKTGYNESREIIEDYYWPGYVERYYSQDYSSYAWQNAGRERTDSVGDTGKAGSREQYSRGISKERSLKEDTEELKRQIDKLNRENARLKAEMKPTTEKTVRLGDTQRAAKALYTRYDIDGDSADIVNDLREIGNYIVQSGGNISYERLKRMALPIAKSMVQNALVRVDDMYNQYSDLRAYIRGAELVLSKEDAANIADFNDFRRHNYGRMPHLKIGSRTNVDSVYRELCELYPEFFNEEEVSHPADQVMTIADALESIQPTYENPYSYNMAAATEHIVNDIIDTMLSEDVRQSAPTFADRQIAKRNRDVARARAAKQEQLSKQEKKHRKEIEQMREESRERTRQALSKEREKSHEREEKTRKEFREREDKLRNKWSARDMMRSINRHADRLTSALLRPNDKRHIPEELRGVVATALYALNRESVYETYIDPDTGKQRRVKIGSEEWFANETSPMKKTLEAHERRKEIAALDARSRLLKKIMSETGGKDNAGEMSFKEAVRALKEHYEKMESGSKDKQQVLIAPEILDKLGELEGLSDTPIGAMDKDQLGVVWETIRMIEASIENADKMFAKGRFANVSRLASRMRDDNYGKRAVTTTIAELKKEGALELLDAQRYFHMLGEAGDALFRGLRKAQDRYNLIKREISEFTRELVKDIDVRALEREKNTVTLGGHERVMSTAQLMELYLLNKRPAGRRHIYGGGIKIDAISGIKSKPAQHYESIRVTRNEINQAISKLTKEQKAVADAMQHFAADNLGAYGNEASMEVFGYKKFKDPNYWSIRAEHWQDLEAKARQNKISNLGHSKSLENASTPLFVGSVFETFSRHAQAQAMYAAYLGIEQDVERVKNYSFWDGEATDEDGNVIYEADGSAKKAVSEDVQGIINRVHGAKGVDYLVKQMQDIQGLASGERDFFSKMSKGLINKNKGAAIGANLRVMIQQPTAYLRNLSMMSVKYLAQAGNVKKGWEKALKYAPIAWQKAVGYTTAKDLMFDTGSILDKIADLTNKGAAAMDAVQFGALWNACEAETKAKRKDLRVGSDEYYKAVADRFTEIVETNQVVDGELQRPQIMRSKNALNQMTTAFMSEPLKQYNMLVGAIYDVQYAQSKEAKAKAWKQLARTVGGLLISAVANSMAAAVVDALRDDEDKEEKFLKRWLDAWIGITEDETGFWGNTKEYFKSTIGGALNPLAYIPYAKDGLSLIMGYDVLRMDMDVPQRFVRAGKDLGQAVAGTGQKSIQEATINMVAESARVFGIPVSNLIRDIKGVLMSTAIQTDNYLMQYELEKWESNMNHDKARGAFIDVLYQAYVNDKDAYEVIYEDMIKSGADAEKIRSGMENRQLKAEGVTKVENLKAQRYLNPELEREFNSKLSTAKTSKAYKAANAKEKDTLEDMIYQLVTKTGNYKDWVRVIEGGAKIGLTEEEWLQYKFGLVVNDEKNGRNKLGTYTTKEMDAALGMMSGLSSAEKDYLKDPSKFLKD